ncbi:MAG: hypothetical protein GY702_12000 [Desulfobulbaceae bacterium]|nr:hypothetical protein [Desulfobulbaceae bacterium]
MVAGQKTLLYIHGAASQRSDPKSGDSKLSTDAFELGMELGSLTAVVVKKDVAFFMQQ